MQENQVRKIRRQIAKETMDRAVVLAVMEAESGMVVSLPLAFVTPTPDVSHYASDMVPSTFMDETLRNMIETSGK